MSSISAFWGHHYSKVLSAEERRDLSRLYKRVLSIKPVGAGLQICSITNNSFNKPAPTYINALSEQHCSHSDENRYSKLSKFNLKLSIPTEKYPVKTLQFRYGNQTRS